MVRILGTRGRKRNLGVLAGTAVLFLVTALLIPASAVLPGSPSKFESGNDPTLGLGNMIVNGVAAGNTDWISVANGGAPYVHLTDAAASTGDNSFTPGQKQDTVCPDVEGHKNPPKDDFTDVASYFEVASGGANDGDVYLYGATIRFAANGNASENIELKQGDSGACPGVGNPLLQRTPGDKLLAIDYLGGGSAVQFHVLTWDADGPCFVANNPAPCWGADVQALNPNVAEGGVNNVAISAANNPISGVNLTAGKFAEFGVNLTDAGILTPGSCEGFSQTIWESRSAGSSFVSSTKDITIEDQDIALCGKVRVRKLGSDGGLQTGAVFTLYEGSGTDPADAVGTCTVDAAGDCLPAFDDLQPGTYTLDETTVPAGYDKAPGLPETFTVAAGDDILKTYTDPIQQGALRILKNSTKGGAVTAAGAVFSYNGASVTDGGATDEDSDTGEVCVSGLAPGTYSVDETSPPPGYGDAPGGAQTVTVVNGTNCTSPLPGVGATATFTNPPLFDIQVNFADGGSGETSIVSIDCDGNTALDVTPATDWDASQTTEDIDFVDESGTGEMTIDCTLVVDP